jgi:hypothetical protein
MSPTKKDPIMERLGHNQVEWDLYLLRTYRLPLVPRPRYEVSETDFVNDDDPDGDVNSFGEFAGRRIRLGEEPPRGMFKVWAEHSGLESEPSAEWKRTRDFYRVFAEIAAYQNQLKKSERDKLVKMAEDLRPNEMDPLPEQMGDPEEFYRRWRRYDLEVVFKAVNRHFIRLVILERKPKFWENFGPRPETERGDFDRRVAPSPETPLDVYIKEQMFLSCVTEIRCPPTLPPLPAPDAEALALAFRPRDGETPEVALHRNFRYLRDLAELKWTLERSR